MILLDILLNFLLQVVFTIGVIVLFGFLIALCNRKFYANFGGAGTVVCYITGFIGTPVHELSHALFCLLFGHKITEIKLFQINSDDGTLGYVRHTYNPKNIYQRIGNFFIGVAPIIVISALLFLLAWLLLPSFVDVLGRVPGQADPDAPLSVFRFIPSVIAAFFSLIVSWQWWVFFVVGIFLALHMTLSGADIKNALGGILFLLIVVLIVDVIVGLISGNALSVMTGGIMSVGMGLFCFLLLALMISVIALLLSFFARLRRKR